jgi:hypothetical protein
MVHGLEEVNRVLSTIIKKIILCFSLLVLLSACNTSQTKTDLDKAFENVINQYYFNGLDISNAQSQAIDSFGGIDLLVKNKTDKCLVISYKHGVRLFSYNDGRWIPITNLAINEGPDGLSLDARSKLFPMTTIPAKPDFSSFSSDQKPNNIRVLILANPCDNPNSNKDTVGGYIDLKLSP